jgi:malonate decarboxylase alpha subunit
MEASPVMIYGDEVTHVVSEVGIAHLWRCRNQDERRACISAVSGEDSVLRERVSGSALQTIRGSGLVQYPEDIGVDPARATGELLAACSLEDIVDWSGGLYVIPDSLR